MSRNIYALLVGINHYKSPTIPLLKGCLNDVKAVADYLQERVERKENICLKTLFNEKATRQAIIDGFREHLCQANSNDIALFYYSGHGSQEQAPEEFWYIEPDHLNETIVCWDSRTENGWDLADKELAVLIAEVAQKNPHILVILDCCHSGGIDRNHSQDSTMRWIPPNFCNRPLDSFIFSPESINNLPSSPNPNKRNSNRFFLPQGEYIFLAACRDNEKAREHYSQERGAFSYFLMDTLQRAKGNVTYRDLFKRTHALVRNFYPNQSPQIEATHSSYLDLLFLGGTIAKQQLYFTVTHERSYGWIIDGGAVHGIQPSSGKEKTRLAIFPLNTNNFRDLAQAIAVAEILEVLPQLSQINLSGEKEELNPELTYKAVITNLPRPLLGVYLNGKELNINLAREALQKASFGEQPSLYICEVLELEEAEFCLIADGEQYLITKPESTCPLIAPIDSYTPESSLQVIQCIEHIAKWTHIASLSNLATSQILPDAIKLKIYQENLEIQESEIRLEYQFKHGEWYPPKVQIKLTNTSTKELYCSLLNLTELYGVKAIPFIGHYSGIWLKPEEEVWVFEGKAIPISIPETLWQQGIIEYKDILKLIVTTSEFDANLLEQSNLEIADNRSLTNAEKSTSIPVKNAFNCLVKQKQTREIVACLEEENLWDDWVTYEVVLVTIKPQIAPSVLLQEKSISVSLEQQTERKWIKPFVLAAIAWLSFSIVVLSFFLWKPIQQEKPNQNQKTRNYLTNDNLMENFDYGTIKS